MKNIFTVLLITVSSSGYSCDCDWFGDFFKASRRMDFVVKGEVVKKIQNQTGFSEKMEVEIIEIFKGIESKKTIVIWGDYGAACRPYISYFEVGCVYYFALLKYDDDYEQLNCGELYLKVDEGKVWGDPRVRPELPKISGMSEAEFTKMLRKK
jgi:hypothetical protein